ncbi:MAG: hypothetical protein U9Q94_07160 [Candidatus Bipolaricaulota bacterium]|nr:hypothetical protein [Candidatus Bipolaricaulota bacterium]
MKLRTWWLLGLLILVAYHAFGLSNAPDAMSLHVQVDDTALPLLMLANVTGGTSPYIVEYSVDTPLIETINVRLTTTSTQWVIPLPTNSLQTIHVRVADSEGFATEMEFDVVRKILQGEPFLLDGTRYDGALVAASESELKLVRKEDSVLSSDPYVLPAPFKFDSTGKPVEITAEWPAHYVVSLSSLRPLVVTISAGEDRRLAIRGMCEDYTGRLLGYTYIDAQIERMAAVGINAVQFIKMFAMDDETDNQIYDPNPMSNVDEELRSGIIAMKQTGFQVMLRLVIFLNAPWPKADNLQTRLAPSDWNEWFRSYEEIALRYAKLAEETGVDIYSFSDTLQTSYVFEEKYRELIGHLRTVYSGELTVLTGPYGEELKKVGFWDVLDYIGIDGSLLTVGYVPFEEANDLSLDEIYKIYLREFEEEVLPTAKSVGKPILWGEIYYRSVERSTYSPSGLPFDQFIQAHDNDEAIDFQFLIDFEQQAKGYSAMLRLMQTYSDAIAGAFHLQWTLEDPLLQWCCSGGSHIIPFTMAEDVFRLWWTQDSQADAFRRTVGLQQERIEYEEFSSTAYRGFWYLESFGDSSATWQEMTEGLDAASIDVIEFAYSNPADDFLRLRYTLNHSMDYSDFDGIVFVVSAEEPCSVRFEVAFSDWRSALSHSYRIGQIPTLIRIPFAAFAVPPEDVIQLHLSSDKVDPTALNAVALRPERGSGTITIYAVGAYRMR